jgi:hypothetical protein
MKYSGVELFRPPCVWRELLTSLLSFRKAGNDDSSSNDDSSTLLSSLSSMVSTKCQSPHLMNASQTIRMV